MSEYIDRESIRRVLMDVCSDENCPMFIAATVDQMIDYEPAADVAPVVHGEWITIDDISRCPTHLKGTAFDVMMVECKQCGASPYAVEVYEYDTEENKRKTIAEFWNRRAE